MPMESQDQLRCFRVVANPPAEVKWFFKDKPLEESGLIRTTQDCRPSLPSQERTCCVKVDLATYAHNGEYTLVAENSLGLANGSMMVDFMLHKPRELTDERDRLKPHHLPTLFPRKNSSSHFYETEQRGRASDPPALGALW
ncbi:unnamed protein product, partial [Darwinula stevensoni]